MNNRNRRRKQKQTLKQISDIISAAALFIIAVLMVVIVILYISNTGISGLFSDSDSVNETLVNNIDEASSDVLSSDEALEVTDTVSAIQSEYGLIWLDNGELVYLMDADEASKYDESCVLDVTSVYNGSDEDVLSSDSNEFFYLIGSWLDLDNNLYCFDDNGYACRDITYSEGAFKFVYDNSGLLVSIKYNDNYSESSSTAREGYPGLISTRTLWAFMDTDKSLGRYTAIKYKKTTESLTSYLGGNTNIQYSSPYAYDIEDGQIFYLAVPDSDESSGSNTALASIVGKVFCMTPGADYREIAAEDAVGFKVVTNSDWETVVYYYDGTSVKRSVSFVKDENMVIFSEDADYLVDISSGSKAYLTTTSGQRVTLETGSFKSGNFTYSLSSEGEILSVASKSSVSYNGYTYQLENGTAFGEEMFRMIRTDSSGTTEVISSETRGVTYNIHYDYSSGCIISEYMDNSGSFGLLKVSLDGDIDFITGSRSTSLAELYAIQNGKGIIKTSSNGSDVFISVSLDETSPLSVGIDPVLVQDNEETEAVETSAPADYDTSNNETQAAETEASAETEAPSPVITNSGNNIISSEGPGSISVSGSGPSSDSSSQVEQVGPGGS